MERTTTTAATSQFKRSHLHVTLDGEVQVVSTPLRFVVQPKASGVLVPTSEPDDDAVEAAPGIT